MEMHTWSVPNRQFVLSPARFVFGSAPELRKKDGACYRD